MRTSPLVLSFLLAASCTSTQHDAREEAPLHLSLRLIGDEGGLHLNGTPANPAYVGTFPNPRQLTEMTVDILSDGRVRASCRDAGGPAECSDPPILTQVQVDDGKMEIWVYDAYGALLIECEPEPCDTPYGCDGPGGDPDAGPGDDGDDGGPDDGDDCNSGDGCPPDDDCDSPYGCPPDDDDCDSPYGCPPDEEPPVDTCDGSYAECACPEEREEYRLRYCAIINQSLRAHGIWYTYDCDDLDGEMEWTLPPQNVEPGCNDIVKDPSEDLEEEMGDSECPLLKLDLVNWQFKARVDLWGAGVCGISPLILDLDGDGIALGAPTAGVRFDLLGDGQPVTTAWPTGNDAFLALDRDGDGRIGGGRELFGNATGGGFHANGFAALATLDADGNGAIDRRDASFAALRLWVDRDRDGQSSAAELATLASAGIASLPLAHRTVKGARDQHGNDMPLVGEFVRRDGSRAKLVDAYLRYEPSERRDELLAQACLAR